MLLVDIKERLESSGNGQMLDRIGEVTAEMLLSVANVRHQYGLYGECREIREELAYDREDMARYLNAAINGEGPEQNGKFTPSQQNAFKAISDAILGKSQQKQFYIDARGGTGKTFLLNRLLYMTRLIDNDAIAIAVAFTGIAAQLLKGGRTFNSRFKFPFKPSSKATCNILKQSGLAKMIRKAKAIVWDEAPMSNRVLLEALDRTLQDLMNNKLPFGGKVIILAGDFRQLPTIIPGASRAQIVGASFKKSYLWENFKVMQLKENIKTHGTSNKLAEFDKWLENLGNGELETIEGSESDIILPQHLCSQIDEDNKKAAQDQAIQFTFGDITTRSALPEWRDFVSKRAILATTNEYVDEINHLCLQEMPGSEIVLASADEAANPDDANQYAVEFINTLKDNGIPPHRLVLKNNAVVMLLRNLNISGGLCNGTRLIVDDVINGRLIKATIATGECVGKTVLIPKILMRPADDNQFGFEWTRLQFPIRLAYAITVHKSQGQTLEKVAVWLQEYCFGHGQLYVAASRVGNPDNIKFYVKKLDGHQDYTTRNIVYHELLQ